MTLPQPYRAKRSAAAAVAARALGTHTPYSAMIEIADRCNEACIHCYQVQGQKGELDTADWERALDELARLGVLFLTISGGEPTLRKDFLHLVRYARRLRFAVKVYSNALNITPELARELGALSVQEVQISLYSAEREIHDRVTRVPGSYDKVLAATRSLREAGVRVLLKTPLMRDNSGGIAEYIALAQSLGADYAFDPQLNAREDGDPTPRALAIDRETYLRARRAAGLVARANPPERALDDTPCGACANNVHIEANGELRPCTQWAVPTGDARQGVADAWVNDPSARVIRGLTWGSLPGCRVCELRSYCKRCFADAAQEVGNALLPYASACTSALWQYEHAHGVAPEVQPSPTGEHAAPGVGPYRFVGAHRLEVVAFERHAADEQRLSAHPWLGGANSLVQLRRRPPRTFTRPGAEPSEQKLESVVPIDREANECREVGAGNPR